MPKFVQTDNASSSIKTANANKILLGIGFKIKFELKQPVLLDKQEKCGLNVIVDFYCCMEGWLCNKDIIFWGLMKWGGGGGWGEAGGDNHTANSRLEDTSLLRTPR